MEQPRLYVTGRLRRLVYKDFHQDLKQPLVHSANVPMAVGGQVPSNTVPANVVAMIKKTGTNIVCHPDDVLGNDVSEALGSFSPSGGSGSSGSTVDGKDNLYTQFQGVCAIGALYSDNATISGEPFDGVVAVAFPNRKR
jgi:hypothetical protein